MSARLAQLLESPTSLASQLGPEGLAVVETLQAAAHGQMRHQSADVDTLCSGDTANAKLLRMFRDADNLFEFGEYMATRVLPVGVVGFLLKGGASQDFMEQFGKILDQQEVNASNEKIVDKVRKEKKALEKNLRRTRCMAVCRKVDGWTIPKTNISLQKFLNRATDDLEENCGGARLGTRCHHIVATVDPHTKRLFQTTGIHVDTKRRNLQNLTGSLTGRIWHVQPTCAWRRCMGRQVSRQRMAAH